VDLSGEFQRAVLGAAQALVVAAGAGMGVDSGPPDFRGDSGFWRAYPAYAKLGLSFVDAANPGHFSAFSGPPL
jgi:NAD-dependent SIR2 family protein deacetylase